MPSPRNRLIFWISVLLAGMFLYFALRGIEWQDFVSTIHRAEYQYLVLAFLLGNIAGWVRANRWRVLLSAEKKIPASNVFWANMAGYLGNNILPARAGELIRAAYISRENNISTSFSLATGLVERFMDLVTLVLLDSISLSVLGVMSEPLQAALKIMAMISVFGIVLFFFLPLFSRLITEFVPRLPILSGSLKERLVVLLDQFLHGVVAFRQPKRVIVFLLLTSLIWLIDAMGVIFAARAFHLNFVLTQSFLLLSALGLSSAIPSTPGYIGVYQFAAVLVLTPFGISSEKAVVLVLVLQVTGFILIAFWGGIAILRASRFLRQSQSN